MEKDETLARISEELRQWAEQRGIRAAAEAKAAEDLNPKWSRNGVPLSELKLEFQSMSLTFDLEEVELPRPLVNVNFSIDYRKPRVRDLANVGRFSAQFDSTGFLAASRFEIHDELLRERRRLPKN